MFLHSFANHLNSESQDHEPFDSFCKSFILNMHFFAYCEIFSVLLI